MEGASPGQVAAEHCDVPFCSTPPPPTVEIAPTTKLIQVSTYSEDFNFVIQRIFIEPNFRAETKGGTGWKVPALAS